MPEFAVNLERLAAQAVTYPNVEETVACKGTKVESHSFKVKKKSFLFLREANIMLKLGASIEEAARLGMAGSGGWVTVRGNAEVVPDLATLERWLDESYRLAAGLPTATP